MLEVVLKIEEVVDASDKVDETDKDRECIKDEVVTLAKTSFGSQILLEVDKRSTVGFVDISSLLLLVVTKLLVVEEMNALSLTLLS